MAGLISNYAKRMGRLGAKIFGEVARTTPKPAFKVVKLFSEKPINKKPSFYDYYPRHVELTALMNKLRFLGLFRNEHQDFQDEMKRLRNLRGKVKTKKGEGKGAEKRLQKTRERKEKMKKRNTKIMFMKKLSSAPIGHVVKAPPKKIKKKKKST